jgi:G3E family GTPase
VSAIPVHLLTGFLGSGKTTLLSRLIRQEGFADTAVVINELGEVGIDHVLVDRGSEDGVVLLDSGCLCCQLGNSLQETLEDLYFRRVRGEIPPFARLVIETTGIADPGPIAATLELDSAIARHYRLAGIVTTIDAVHGGDQLDRFGEALRQAALADRLVVTKTDIATQREAASLRARLAALNPHAAQVTAVDGIAEASDVLVEAALPRAAAPDRDDVPAGARTHEHATRHAHNHAADHDHGDGHDHLGEQGIASRVVRLDAPLAWSRYAGWVSWMQRSFGEQLLRMKGVVRMDDGGAYALHAVMRLFSAPRPLASLPADAGNGVVVLIAQHAEPALLDDAMRRLVRDT